MTILIAKRAGQVFTLFQSTAVLLVLVATLATSTAALTFRTITLGAQVTAGAAQAAAAAVTQRKAIAAAVARVKVREKAKARLKRMLVAVPVIGLGVAGGFEYTDYKEWQNDNPEGTAGEYGCEVATVSAEVVDDVLQELPKRARPSRKFVLGLLPDCETEND